MSLVDALNWVISGGGAAIGGFELVEHVPWFSTLPSDWKRYIAFALTAILAIAAWAALTALTAAGWPANLADWCTRLFTVASAAIIAGQAIHGAAVLRKR